MTTIEIYFQIATLVTGFLGVLCFSAIGVVACTSSPHKPARLRNTGNWARNMRRN